jgi:glycosyltransferase involved in cell wall biosynthesis
MTSILQLLPALNSGGVERGTLEMAQSLVENGYKSYVVSAGGVFVHALEEKGSTHIRIPSLEYKDPISLLQSAWKLKKVIEACQPSLIHVRSRHPGWILWLVEHVLRIRRHYKVVTTFHGYYSHRSALKRFYNSIMLRAEKVIAASQFIKAHLLEVYQCDSHRIALIPRGVDLSYFNPDNISQDSIASLKRNLGIKEKSPVLLLPSRMTSWKGHLVFLEALSRLKDYPWTAILCGRFDPHSAYFQKVSQKIKEWGLSDRVLILQNREDMPLMYAMTDWVVSCSTKGEAFGRVIAEAQAMGKYVIATDVGGSKETVVPNETGVLIPPSDPQFLKNVLEQALQGKITQNPYVSRSHIQNHFSLEFMCESTIKVYESLIK